MKPLQLCTIAVAAMCAALAAPTVAFGSSPATVAKSAPVLVRDDSVTTNPHDLSAQATKTEGVFTVTTATLDTHGEMQIDTVALPTRTAVAEQVEHDQNNPDVYAVSTTPIRVRAAATPNDTYRGSQWAHNVLNIDQVHDIATGAGVTVAVVDTGIQANHPDLVGKVTAGTDTTSEALSPGVDPDGHGTHVAGIIAANTNNAAGVASIAPDASLLSVKALLGDGTGWSTDIAEGVTWAVNNGADVINLSLAVDGDDPVLETAINYANTANVTVAAAMGNDRIVNTVSYPAAYSTVLAVGSTDSSDNLSTYHNTGSHIKLVAPGNSILSTDTGSGYATMTGSSMATPHVAAAAALLREMHVDYTPAQIRTALQNSAVDKGASGWDSVAGYGRVNIYAALTGDAVPPDTTTAPSPPVVTPPDVQPVTQLRAVKTKRQVTIRWTKGANSSTSVIRVSKRNKVNSYKPWFTTSGTSKKLTLAQGKYRVQVVAVAANGTRTASKTLTFRR